MSTKDGKKIKIESGTDDGALEEDIAKEETGSEVTEDGADIPAGDKPEESVPEAAEDQPETEDAGSPDEDSGEGRKKHSGKKNKKDPRDEKIAELEDRVKRQMAEFENFRKRTDKEKSQMYDMGARCVIEKILPVIDNFERGLESVPEGCDQAFVDGMQMIYKQLSSELEKLGVKEIEAVGTPFDPNIHNAVMQVESDEYESGTVAAQLQKGYTYHDTLVRPSMVSVVS